MIRKRFGTFFILLFFLAVLTGGIIYDDLSASDSEDPYAAIKLLNEAIHQVSEKYVDEIESDSLYMRALEGMLGSLDPYSQLLSPTEYNDLRIHTQGNYEGLGIRIDIVQQILTVIAPIEGTPAGRASKRNRHTRDALAFGKQAHLECGRRQHVRSLLERVDHRLGQLPENDGTVMVCRW